MRIRGPIFIVNQNRRLLSTCFLCYSIVFLSFFFFSCRFVFVFLFRSSFFPAWLEPWTIECTCTYRLMRASYLTYFFFCSPHKPARPHMKVGFSQMRDQVENRYSRKTFHFEFAGRFSFQKERRGVLIWKSDSLESSIIRNDYAECSRI